MESLRLVFVIDVVDFTSTVLPGGPDHAVLDGQVDSYGRGGIEKPPPDRPRGDGSCDTGNFQIKTFGNAVEAHQARPLEVWRDRLDVPVLFENPANSSWQVNLRHYRETLSQRRVGGNS